MKASAYVVERTNAPFVLEDIELDAPGPGEVLVRVVSTGVCHTDMIARSGDMPLPLPGIMGHEGAGIVEEVGDGVTTVKAGDRVIMGWPFCGECRNCRRGEHRYCAQLGPAVLSGRRYSGPQTGQSSYRRSDGSELSGHFFAQSSFATYSITTANSVVKLDDDVDLDIAGVLACGITTGAGAILNTAKPAAGDSLVIYGAGAVGLAAVMAAVNTPATTIIAVDLHDSRLALAEKYGATHTINSREGGVKEKIREIVGGDVDYAVDCTGVIAVIEEAAEIIGMLGTLILVGGAPAGSRFSADHASFLWGRTVVGTLGGGGTAHDLIPALLQLNKLGRFPFDELIRFYDFDQLEQAVADSTSGETVKPVLRVG
ncbi:NAD(P)-dependent alcohol dehydrogenase [Nesterenkonia flava]|uniref:NAD(P)-dependent alcohol dehydrogenase n=1 Tax=Nesterenkonia flava TaxID=469799 RepID=A0ABU1FTD4_9MICC|nr:NAD(P)-dependent alcohol dehydrogenase [Nesterenkonia flava]MDR5711924.1 NAD(P)-dependent alcohol dehydrogenase [Nesterenkonia flava]